MYRPSDEALMQLGLYDYVWGDNAMLQNYLSRLSQEEQRQFQAEENAKNRQAQREYNEYLKEYDRAKADREEAIRKADEQRQRDAEKARLYKLYNEAEGAQEKAYIAKQLAVLEGRDTENAEDIRDEMLIAYDTDKAAKEEAERAERERKHNALDTLAKIDTEKKKATKAAQKEALAKEIATDTEKYPYLTQEERDKIIADIRGIKTLDDMMREAAQNAAVQNVGNLTAEKLAWQNVLKRSKETGYVPSTADKDIAKKNGFHWDKTLKDFVK